MKVDLTEPMAQTHAILLKCSGTLRGDGVSVAALTRAAVGSALPISGLHAQRRQSPVFPSEEKTDFLESRIFSIPTTPEFPKSS